VGVVRSNGFLRFIEQNALQLRAFGCAAIGAVAVASAVRSGVAHCRFGVEQSGIPVGEKAESAALYVAAGVAGGVVECDQALQHGAVDAGAFGCQSGNFLANHREGLDKQLDFFHRRGQVHCLVAVGDEAAVQGVEVARDEGDRVDGRRVDPLLALPLSLPASRVEVSRASSIAAASRIWLSHWPWTLVKLPHLMARSSL
jgi:hypothetical protein